MQRSASSIALLSCLLLGCSDGGPATHTVTGVITYAGKPVADAQVGFVPVGDSPDVKPARGQTDAGGRYALRTYVKPGLDVPGAMAGRYKVTVTQGIAEKRIVEYADLAKKRETLPAKCADAQTTPLSANVTAGGANTFDFALETP